MILKERPKKEERRFSAMKNVCWRKEETLDKKLEALEKEGIETHKQRKRISKKRNKKSKSFVESHLQ